jgi:hypothetical protein
MMANTHNAPSTTQIVRTCDECDLDRITSPEVLAVVYTPATLPDWFLEVASAVENEFLQIPRGVLPAADLREIGDWLEERIPADALTPATCTALKQDIVRLAERIARASGATRFQLRIFTEAPTTNCGFHVDTVPPAAPKWGLLRVYNGAGTDYVDPSEVVSTSAFYHYMACRERLARERALARRRSDAERLAQLDAEVQSLDRARAFLAPTAMVHHAPSRSIVAFKHLDVSLHWSDHSRALAWIHCSPMSGVPRLVVNVSAAPGGPVTTRPGTHATARRSPPPPT